MERESFEDEDTAALMNEHFVSIKVDREERPDLDAIYMDAAQAMTGSGGWPLTAFLTPDGRAVLRGHVLPARCRGTACRRSARCSTGIAEAWTERRDEVVTQGAKIAEHIARVGLLSAFARTADGRDHARPRSRACVRRSTTSGAGSAARRSSRNR